MVDLVYNHFPNLSSKQHSQIQLLESIYREWNQKINLISRKDIEHLYSKHVLHSLTIAKYISFAPSTTVLDLGIGGGFPGIPLAILFPEVEFRLIDGTGKKIGAVQEIINQLNLKNTSSQQIRAEEVKNQYDFVVSRAVAKLDQLWRWSKPLIHTNQKNALPNGLICLKGGNIQEELNPLNKEYFETVKIDHYFGELFSEKYVIYIQK